jgi:uncharacterized membrane protein YfcA
MKESCFNLNMLDWITYWYLFPVSFAIATIAMMLGIGGAILFSPFFVLVLSLRPDIAISLGLLIEFFGFSSGFIGYARNRMINYHLGSRIIPIAASSALVGAVLGKYIEESIIQLLLAAVLFLLAIAFIMKDTVIEATDTPLHPENYNGNLKTKWYDYWKDFKKKPSLFLGSSIGGLLVGLVSSGLGEINEYNFVKRMGLNTSLAAGTSVFVIAVTALIASIFNMSYFTAIDTEDLLLIGQIALFAVPGVVLGAQVGVVVSRKVNRRKAMKVLPFLFIVLGVLTVLKVFI